MENLENYLDQVCRGVGGPRSLRQHIRQELREHLLDAVAEHKRAGLSEDQALDRALQDFGGADLVRSELEATHGHRLLAVVIDKAMQWQEKTMKAKWLWTTWAYLATVGVIGLDLLFICFSGAFFLPKMQKIRSEGLLDIDSAMAEPVMQFGWSFLHRIDALREHILLLLAGLVVGWGIFEWRVRGENKPFIRMSLLGTGAVLLTAAVIISGAALVLPFLLGLPAINRVTWGFALEQLDRVDPLVATLDQSAVKREWSAISEQAKRVSEEIQHLESSIADLNARLMSRPDQPWNAKLLSALSTARTPLQDVQKAVQEKSAERLDAAVRDFHGKYDRLRPVPRRGK